MRKIEHFYAVRNEHRGLRAQDFQPPWSFNIFESRVSAGVCLARTVLKCVQVQRVPFSEGGSAVHRSNSSKANGSHGRDLTVARGAISFSGGGGG